MACSTTVKDDASGEDEEPPPDFKSESHLNASNHSARGMTCQVIYSLWSYLKSLFTPFAYLLLSTTVKDDASGEDEDPPPDIKSESQLNASYGKMDVLKFIIITYVAQVGKGNSLPTESKESNDDSDESYPDKREKRRPKRRVKRQEKSYAIIEKNVHQSVGPASLSAADRKFFTMSDDIMIQLQQVRDQGQWEEFVLVAKLLSKRYPCLEAQVIIKIEKGQAACYSNQFEESEKLLEEARSMAVHTVNAPLLLGRIYYYLSALYRRDGKLGKAEDYVQLASQNLHHTGLVLDTAMLTYERASARMDFILQCANPNPNCKKEVMADLRRAIDQILALKEDSSTNRYLKTHRYAFIKMAFLHLDCRTAAGRQRTVSKTDVEEAKKYLDVIRDRYWEETTRGERIQFFLAQSDLHFRQKNYKDANKSALEARSMAEKFGFYTEIQLANDRLHAIKQASPLTSDDGLHTNTALDVGNPDNRDANANVCVHGKRHSTRNGIPADGDAVHGNTASDISRSDSDSQTERGSSEGHIGNVDSRSAASSGEFDFLNSPSYV